MSCFKGLLGKKKNSYTVNSGYMGKAEGNQYRASNGHLEDNTSDYTEAEKNKNQLNNSEVIQVDQESPAVIIKAEDNLPISVANGHVHEDDDEKTAREPDQPEPPIILVNGKEGEPEKEDSVADTSDDNVCHSEPEDEAGEGESNVVIVSAESVELVESVGPPSVVNETGEVPEDGPGEVPENGPGEVPEPPETVSALHLDMSHENTSPDVGEQFMESPTGTWDGRLNAEMTTTGQENQQQSPTEGEKDEDTPAEVNEVTTTTTTTTITTITTEGSEQTSVSDTEVTSTSPDITQETEEPVAGNEHDACTEEDITVTTTHTTTVTVVDSPDDKEEMSEVQNSSPQYDQFGSHENEMIQIGISDVAYVDPRQEIY